MFTFFGTLLFVCTFSLFGIVFVEIGDDYDNREKRISYRVIPHVHAFR